MKILLPDGTELTEELMDEWAEKQSKKCGQNWLDKKFPNGIAEHNPRYALLHPWVIVEYWIQEVIFAWQRVFRGWDDRAIWGIDSYISTLIPKLVKELRQKQGIPSFCFEGLEEEKNGNFTEEAEKIAEKRWHDVLDKIILGFEGYDKITFYSSQAEEEKELIENFEEGFALFKEHFPSLWW